MRVLQLIYHEHEVPVLDWIRGFDTMEVEVREELVSRKDHDYVDTVNGIDVWYNWRADYYVFTEEEVEDE